MSSKIVPLKVAVEYAVCEQATGIAASARDGGQLYDDDGNQLSDRAARAEFRAGGRVEAPNAGAGSYRMILCRLGYTRVQVEDWTSSAGDWLFSVRIRGRKRYVSQCNRYPYHGFAYSLGNE